MNNVTTTGYCNIGRGVREVNALSAYIFMLVTELLTLAIFNITRYIMNNVTTTSYLKARPPSVSTPFHFNN